MKYKFILFSPGLLKSPVKKQSESPDHGTLSRDDESINKSSPKSS